ncbi:ISAs1 family transposase [Singulisphaera sp. Ch08]|uniref:ISAs1 family transposase n=1 Tax=Singulisphaera sp. Ch08 TaxID=3120278 RepID=A0AAU7CMV8_9BACT
MVDIAIIAVCGVICGCDGPTAIHRWDKNRASWLAQHLALPNGIPSRDCIRRLLMALKPEAFQRCFQAWICDAIPADPKNPRRLVAIDGKACRGSHDAAKGLGNLCTSSAPGPASSRASRWVRWPPKLSTWTGSFFVLNHVQIMGATGCTQPVSQKPGQSFTG